MGWFVWLGSRSRRLQDSGDRFYKVGNAAINVHCSSNYMLQLVIERLLRP